MDGSPRIGNIAEDPEKTWRKTMTGTIGQADAANGISRLITKPYRFAFLKYAMPHMSRQDFSECRLVKHIGQRTQREKASRGAS